MYPAQMNGTESPNEVAEECISLIAKQKSIDPEQIHLDSSFEEMAVDSLDRVSLAFDIEEKYEIEIPESMIEKIKTVRDMVTGIEEALRQKNASADSVGPDSGNPAKKA
jgi:acyl carrier protein